MNTKYILSFAVFGFIAVAGQGMSCAQDAAATPPAETSSLGLTHAAASLDPNNLPPEVRILKNIEKELKKNKGKDIFERSSIPSLVFTPSQYALLREARVGLMARPPTDAELKNSADPNDPNYRAPMTLRDIQLGGIAFSTPDDWTIWLNNARVTPDALPSEVIDLRVYKSFIELKWFDAQTNQIYPVRLRPNQKFNLDTHVFLPG